MSFNASTCRDDGTLDVPGKNSDWNLWVSASRIRNYVNDDPLLDWLSEHGETKGFVRDDRITGHDARTDFGAFVLAKGVEFENAVLQHLRKSRQLVTIATNRGDARSLAAVTKTWEAMVAGVEIIAQAPVWNPQTQTYGVIDLLVRSDVLESLFPGHVGAAARESAPDLPAARWHYRVVDVKFSTLSLLKTGHVASDHFHYAAQVWLYNEAVGRLQGLTPESSYLLGRGWRVSDDRGDSAIERLSRVDHGGLAGKDGPPLRELAIRACEWVRRVRTEGASWDALPEPTVNELRPNMRASEDAPWRKAKRRIAETLEDLTLFPRVNPRMRDAALARGVKTWRDSACSAALFGIRGQSHGPLVDEVIRANHSAPDGPVVFPARVTVHEDRWRKPAPVEFFVDFETVNDLNDDFTTFPKKGGQTLIFMVGCGYRSRNGTWTTDVLTVDRLELAEERRVLDEWLQGMRAACSEAGTSLASSRLFHWSGAEVTSVETGYESAAARHQLPTWNSLPWVDLLSDVFREQPVTVRGAFGFGLKAVTKAMHAAGLVATDWPDGVADGLGAMAGAWWCDREARLGRGPMRSQALMRQIEAYNRVDVEAMRDILDWLRKNR